MKQIKLTLIFLLLISGILYFSSCSEDTIAPVQTTNNVQGYVKSANGQVVVAGATIILASTLDATDTTTSDANGFFQFQNVANGNYTLTYNKGSFTYSQNIVVPLSGNVPDALLQPTKPMAFLWGEYDDIQTIIRAMGYTGVSLESLTVASFNNLTLLNTYSIIFLNCGNDSRYNLNTGIITTNLRSYIQGGGKIYASDWAFGAIQPIYPTEFFGNYIGNSQDSVQGNVNYAPLVDYLGKSTVSINYNLSSWLMLTAIGPNAQQFISNTPLGTLAFYRNDSNNGKLIYTTFHNEAQMTGDMIKILQFFVFEL